MGSPTKKTWARRNRKLAKSAKRNKKERMASSSPVFPIHPDGKVTVAAARPKTEAKKAAPKPAAKKPAAKKPAAKKPAAKKPAAKKPAAKKPAAKKTE